VKNAVLKGSSGFGAQQKTKTGMTVTDAPNNAYSWWSAAVDSSPLVNPPPVDIPPAP